MHPLSKKQIFKCQKIQNNFFAYTSRHFVLVQKISWWKDIFCELCKKDKFGQYKMTLYGTCFCLFCTDHKKWLFTAKLFVLTQNFLMYIRFFLRIFWHIEKFLNLFYTTGADAPVTRNAASLDKAFQFQARRNRKMKCTEPCQGHQTPAQNARLRWSTPSFPIPALGHWRHHLQQGSTPDTRYSNEILPLWFASLV